MPTNVWGVAFYVFALFPGVAFIFAREGHRPAVKRSALRETAAVVFVSAICAAAIAVPVAILACFWGDFEQNVVDLLGGDTTWIRENLAASIALGIAILTLTTMLGFALGTEWADQHGLDRLWRSTIPRDTSAWNALFSGAEDSQIVEVAITLKSGAWVSGTLYNFDNDPDPHPHRAITLTQPSYRSAGDDEVVDLEGTDYLVVEAADIELLQTSYKELESANIPVAVRT